MEFYTEEKNTESEEKEVFEIFKVTGKLNDKTVFLNPSEIDSIESINGVSQIKIEKDTFASNYTLTELESRLKQFGFFRCHRSYLVNL